jgi:sugar phosphate isomerase/epimerase
VDAHKKHTFGYIQDAQQLTAALQEQGLTLYVNIDTAHCWLNEEDPLEMLKAVSQVQEFHFCNCVTDSDSELYGDNHMPLGEPGKMTQAAMTRMIAQLIETGFLNQHDKPYLLFEVIKPPAVDSHTHLLNCKQFFIDSLAQV